MVPRFIIIYIIINSVVKITTEIMVIEYFTFTMEIS